MTAFLKLHAYTTEQSDGGVCITGISRTFMFNDGIAMDVPIPFLPIGNDLVLTPQVDVDGDQTLRVNLTLWCPGTASPRLVASLPVHCDQATAVRVARAYDADPATSWTDPASTVATWLSAWAAANGVTVTFDGLDDAGVSA
jgi:hypothetical protein